MLSRKVVRIIGNILIGRKIEEAHTVVREKKMIFINDDILRFGHIIFISCNFSQNFVKIVLENIWKVSKFQPKTPVLPSSALTVYYYTVRITVTYSLIYECIIFPHKTQMKLELPSYQIQGYLLY